MLFAHPKKTTLVYTSIFGDRKRDFLTKPFLISNCDYTCFTNRQKIEDKTWKIHKIYKKEENARRQSRFYKMLCYTLYPHYDYYVYIDSNVRITKNFVPQMIASLSDVDICFAKHPFEKCTYKEISRIEKIWKEHEICKSLREKLKSEKFPSNNGCVAGNRFFYKNEPNSKKFLSFWHENYCLYSQGDQATVDYCLWKLKTKVKYISYATLSQYGLKK